jgi:hypothetical protein
MLTAHVCAGEIAKVKGAAWLRVACLASRKVLCVNSAVTKLASAWRINDRCSELQRATTTKKQALAGQLLTHAFHLTVTASAAAYPAMVIVCCHCTVNAPDYSDRSWQCFGHPLVLLQRRLLPSAMLAPVCIASRAQRRSCPSTCA